MGRNALTTVLICLALALCASPMMLSDDSSAESLELGDLRVHTFTESISLSAGGSDSFEVEMFNKMPDAPETPSTYQIHVSASIDCSRADAGCILSASSVDGGGTATAVVSVSADRLATGTHTLTITVKAVNISEPGSPETTGIISIPVKISSHYASGDSYNRIMGFIESPIDNPLANAGITLAIWIAIAFAVDFLLLGALRRRAGKAGFEEGLKDSKITGRFTFVLILLIGIPQSLRVGGANSDAISFASDTVEVIMGLVVAIIAWKVYKIVMYNIIVTRDRYDRIDDSLFPLVKMVGKTVILIAAASYILSVFGMDLSAIVASAGIITLAVSFGAQNTLNQFFCGIVLLTTRPFRIGDKVKLGSGGEVLIVRKIGVMETEFKVWLNEEVQRIPNSTVMSSSIVNITDSDKTYKVVDYIDVDYGADLDKAREIIMSIVSAHPKIVNDGSKSRPDFRFNSMESSAIRIRLSYIVYDHELYHQVSCQVKEMIYRKFAAEGIAVPHNIVDVHLG